MATTVITMAQAMLEDETFKSSHQDLMSLDNNNREDRQERRNNTATSSKKPAPASSHHLPTRKSVDFAILPPPSSPKRQRTSNRTNSGSIPWTAKQVVDAIATSVTPPERLEAIQKAKDSFHHDVQKVHDDEFSTGADAALTKHLVYLVYQYQQSQSQDDDTASAISVSAARDRETTSSSLRLEISLTCDAMESLYRASSHIVGASFRRMGTDLMAVLVHIMRDELELRHRQVAAASSRSRQQQEQQQKNHDARQAAAAAAAAAATVVDSALLASSPPNTPPPDKEQGGEGRGGARPIKQEPDDSEEENDGKPAAFSPSSGSTTSRPITPPATTTATTGGGEYSNKSNNRNAEGDLLLKKATKILGHFARVGDATQPIAHFPGLLSCLLQLITLRPYNCVPWEARLSALWIIANLACDADNMQMMVCTPNLVQALIDIASRPLDKRDDSGHCTTTIEATMEVLRSRNIASRAILNLSWAPENKVLLAENAALIDMLVELTVQRNSPLYRSQTVHEILVATRRHASGALRNLAAAPRRVKIGLCNYRNGILLDVLTDAALNDVYIKDRAFACIHNLAIHDTAERMVSHPALVLALKDVLLSNGVAGDTREHASKTLMVLERSITQDMDSFENLRDLLEALSSSTRDNNNEQQGGDDGVVNETVAV